MDRRRAVESHLVRCTACRDTVQEQRRVRDRLQNSGIPGPGADLHARIMESTRSFESGGQPGLSDAPGLRGRPGATLQRHRRVAGFTARHKTPMVVGAGLAVVALATLTGAYALGSESGDELLAGNTQTSALVAGWESVAEETPSILDAAALDELRGGGWYCPELEAMGFEVESAEAITVGGRPTLMMVLDDGTNSVTVYEQRKLGNDRRPENSPPINAETGNLVTADGFERIGGMQRQMWVHPGRSWQVVLDSRSVTYTVISSLPAADMPRTVNQLVLAEHSQLAQTQPTPHDPVSRILRGLGKLTQPSSGE